MSPVRCHAGEMQGRCRAAMLLVCQKYCSEQEQLNDGVLVSLKKWTRSGRGPESGTG